MPRRHSATAVPSRFALESSAATASSVQQLEPAGAARAPSPSLTAEEQASSQRALAAGQGPGLPVVDGRIVKPKPGAPWLAPAGEGLLVTNQMFAWTGARDSLRITARAADGRTLGQSTIAIDSAPPQARYLFPLVGRLYVQAGPSPHTHHRWAPPEAFAYDIVRLANGGSTHSGDGMKFTDYAVYGASIRAAADGEVVAVVSDQIEDPAQFRRPGETTEAYFGRIQTWQAEGMTRGDAFLAGNYVVIRHPWGEYSVYVHMKPGSARVKPGQTVKAGAMIGQVGSSGSSTEPHLHFQVCDSPGPLDCVGLPVAFTGAEVPFALLPGAIQSGDIVEAR